MKNFRKLSRNDLRDVFGGKKTCSLSVQQSDGSWQTLQGECKAAIDDYSISNSDGHITIQITASHQYCETGSGEHSVSSNGGVSRCN